MSSQARKQRRGKVDQFGRKIPKRMYNNKKRTKGRQGQEIVKLNYHEMIKRIRYIKKLIRAMRDDERKLTEDNWVKIVREYDQHKLLFDDYEKRLIFQYTNIGR